MNARSNMLPIVALGVAALGLAADAVGQDGRDAKENAAKIGEKVPNFTLTDSAGQERSLASYEGKTVILEWINPECPYVVNCYRSGAMTGAYKNVKALDPTVVWLAINSTSTTKPQRNQLWIEQHKIKYPILMDLEGTVGRLYDARRTPHMFVIDKKGILRYHGAIDDNRFANKPADEVTTYVVNAVKQLVAEETVTPDYVKPYGCTVKYKR